MIEFGDDMITDILKIKPIYISSLNTQRKIKLKNVKFKYPVTE